MRCYCLTSIRSVAVSLMVFGAVAAGAEVSVKATLSRSTVELGESVQLQIEVTGNQRDVSPPAIQFEEIDAVHRGQRIGSTTNFDGARLVMTSNTFHFYQLTPRQAGNFTIPGIPVQVDGRTYKTQPIGLKVEKGGGRQGSSDTNERNLAFAELIVPRTNAFVGEVLPIEFKFYLDSTVRRNLEQAPVINGTGFTAQKFPEPRQERSQKNGRNWDVFTYRGAISPSKAGKMSLGPGELTFVAQVRVTPSARRGVPRSLFDSFLDDDFFGRAFSEPQRYRVEAAAVEIDVKPLPTQDRPKDFSGAIGQFKLSVEGTPNRVKIGDPITMRSKISGTGNFDRMQAPTLADPSGWHAYPVSEKFEPADDLKLSGTKTFEMPVVPEAIHQQMPRFQFAFFDPEKAEYVTLTSAAAPLTVEGSPVPPPAPSRAPAEQPSTARSSTTPPVEPAAHAPTDILGLRYDPGTRRSTFSPLFARRVFWLAQLALLAVLCALLGARFLQRDARASRIGALQRERDRLWQRLRKENGGSDFYETAARLVQVETALRTGMEPASVDALIARRARPLDEETAAQIEEIFNARAELLYAGSGPPTATVSQTDRARVLAALDRFIKNHG